jgi:hypothetical protein
VKVESEKLKVESGKLKVKQKVKSGKLKVESEVESLKLKYLIPIKWQVPISHFQTGNDIGNAGQLKVADKLFQFNPSKDSLQLLTCPARCFHPEDFLAVAPQAINRHPMPNSRRQTAQLNVHPRV